MNVSVSLRSIFWVLFILFAAMALFSNYGFVTLAGSFETILHENYDSVVAAGGMLESIEASNAMILRALAPGAPPPALAEPLSRFSEHFGRAEGNVTLPGEGDVVARLKARHAELLEELRAYVASDPVGRAERYDQKLAPCFEALRSDILALMKMNQTAIAWYDRRARELSTKYSILAGLIGFIGLITALVLNHRINATLLEPLAGMQVMAQRMSHGDFSMRLPQNRRDEFGVLSGEINRLVERMELGREESRSYAIQQRQIASALIEHYPDPVLLLDNLGEVVIANAPARLIVTGPESTAALLDIRAALDVDREFVSEGLRYRVAVEPLLAASRKMIGSLVRLAVAGPVAPATATTPS